MAFETLNTLWQKKYQILESFQKIFYYKVFSWDKLEDYLYTPNIPDQNINIILKPLKENYTESNIDFAFEVKSFERYTITEENNNHRFGGISGIDFDEQGNLYMVSDRGAGFKTTPLYNDAGNLKGFMDSMLIGLKNFNSADFTNMNERDFEEIDIFRGNCFVSNEGIHQIFKYQNCDFSNLDSVITTPNWINIFPQNKGIEAFSINKNGNILAISEYGINNEEQNINTHLAYYWNLNENFSTSDSLKTFYYISNPNFGASGMTFLSNGDALIIERYADEKIPGLLANYKVDIKYLTKTDIENSPKLEGKTIIKIDSDSHKGKFDFADNFESIAVREKGEDLYIYLLTDNGNVAYAQSTLLEIKTSLTDLENCLETDTIDDTLEEQHNHDEL